MFYEQFRPAPVYKSVSRASFVLARACVYSIHVIPSRRAINGRDRPVVVVVFVSDGALSPDVSHLVPRLLIIALISPRPYAETVRTRGSTEFPLQCLRCLLCGYARNRVTNARAVRDYPENRGREQEHKFIFFVCYLYYNLCN